METIEQFIIKAELLGMTDSNFIAQFNRYLLNDRIVAFTNSKLSFSKDNAIKDSFSSHELNLAIHKNIRIKIKCTRLKIKPPWAE